MDIGTVVLRYIPFVDGPGGKLRPVLVLGSRTGADGTVHVTAAWGSSQRVSHTGHWPHEMVVDPSLPEGKGSGLHRATRFDLRYRLAFDVAPTDRILGKLDMKNARVQRELRQAARAAGLLP